MMTADLANRIATAYNLTIPVAIIVPLVLNYIARLQRTKNQQMLMSATNSNRAFWGIGLFVLSWAVHRSHWAVALLMSGTGEYAAWSAWTKGYLVIPIFIGHVALWYGWHQLIEPVFGKHWWVPTFILTVCVFMAGFFGAV